MTNTEVQDQLYDLQALARKKAVEIMDIQIAIADLRTKCNHKLYNGKTALEFEDASNYQGMYCRICEKDFAP